MGTTRYSYHPACLAFPMLAEAELKELADDIKKRGLLTPIVKHQNKILDGRNRLAACKIAKVEPRFIEWEGQGSPTEWVIATNLFRRQLTASQRAVVALDLLPMLEKEAKERLRRSRGRGKKGGKELPTTFANGKASQMAADLTKSNRLYVQTAKGIRQSAPELIEEIRGGKLTVTDAKRLAELPVPQRKAVLKRANGEANGKLKKIIKAVQIEERKKEAKRFQITYGGSDDQNILVGDMGILWNRLADGSVDLFLTDPVYTDVDAYSRLAELAAAKLKPGGLCLAYCGHVQLPDVIEAMRRHLTWWWPFFVEVAGEPCPIHARRIHCRQKPVVARHRSRCRWSPRRSRQERSPSLVFLGSP